MTPMNLATYLDLMNLHGPEQYATRLTPTRLDLKLGDYFVRVIEFTPKRRHVHYEVLRERRRKNQAPDRRWMKTKHFMREATVAGYFKRDGEGILRWCEPWVGVDHAKNGTDFTVVGTVELKVGAPRVRLDVMHFDVR